MRCRYRPRLIGLFAWLLAASALAGPGEQVDVRVIDAVTGQLLAERRLGFEARMAFSREQGQRRYLGLRGDRFRGQDLIAFSISAKRGDWNGQGRAAWNQPSVQSLDDIRVRLELVPVGWGERFCAIADRYDPPAERDPIIELTLPGGERMISSPGWSGRGMTRLEPISRSEALDGWEAGIDDQGRFDLITPAGRRHTVAESLREDFVLLRHLEIDGRVIAASYQPGNYSQRFCRARQEAGDALDREVVDYAFGR